MSETETRTKNELMGIWLRDLETTTAPQCQGTKYNGTGYCCLGRVDEACFHESFVFVDGKYLDYKGNYLSLSGERIKSLGLDKHINAIEKLWFVEQGFMPQETPTNRMAACAEMNDSLMLTFPQIAAQIRAWGWDKD